MTLDDNEPPVHQPTPPDDIIEPKKIHIPPPPFPVWVPVVLTMLMVMSWAGRALIPFIDEVPLLVVSLSPDSYLVPIVAEKVDLWPLLIVVTIRLLIADPVWYHLGRYCSEWVLASKGKKSRKIFKKPRKLLEALVYHQENKHLKSRNVRWTIQGGVYLLVLLYATGFVMCAAGILELRRRVVAILAITGTLLQVYGLIALGTYLF